MSLKPEKDQEASWITHKLPDPSQDSLFKISDYIEKSFRKRREPEFPIYK